MTKRTVQRPAVQAKNAIEGIENIHITPNAIFLTINDMIEDEDGVYHFDRQGITKNHLITGDALTELMKGDPSWAPGKPANNYRIDDLWYIVDEMVADRLSSLLPEQAQGQNPLLP